MHPGLTLDLLEAGECGAVENNLRPIGEMAQDSGLTVSALRFYDTAGVLVPAWVDPASGYRWYSPEQLAEGRLLARLRRVGMPLADIRLVLAGRSGADTALVHRLLEAHVRRLERAVAEARIEFSAIEARLDLREDLMTAVRTPSARLALEPTALAAALDAVRFAASTDPQLPMLGGILFDVEGDRLRLVATDRYRMAVAHAPVAGHDGPRVQAIVPTPLADAMRALLPGASHAQVTVEGNRVALEAAGRTAAGPCPDHEFPDYRRLVSLPTGRRVSVDAPALRQAAETGPVRAGRLREQDGAYYDAIVLRLGGEEAVAVAEDGDGHDRIAVNREFLLHALTAADRDRLILEFSDRTAPLVVRRPDDEDTFSMLMPVRLEN